MKNKIFLFSLLILLAGCNGRKNASIATNIHILDKASPISSFSELTNKLEGKAIYIDRWASWCTPCIEEFKHNEALHDFLHAHDIEMVYLNSDTELDEQAWLDFINEHQLKGNHLRMDSILKADLIDKGIFIPMIPQYIIVGTNGAVITNSALRPSSGEELFNQLKEALKLKNVP